MALRRGDCIMTDVPLVQFKFLFSGGISGKRSMAFAYIIRTILADATKLRWSLIADLAGNKEK